MAKAEVWAGADVGVGPGTGAETGAGARAGAGAGAGVRLGVGLVLQLEHGSRGAGVLRMGEWGDHVRGGCWSCLASCWMAGRQVSCLFRCW